MANWQRTLDLTPEYYQAQDGTISPSGMAKIICQRLAKLEPFGIPRIDERRTEILESFRCLAEDPGAEDDEFNDAMNDLYDWGDDTIGRQTFNGRKVCWIKTH